MNATQVVVIGVSKPSSFLRDDPRPEIVGGLLPIKKKVGSTKSPWSCGRATTHKKKMGSAKSPFADAILKEGWMVTTHFESHIAKLRLGI